MQEYDDTLNLYWSFRSKC